MPRQSKRITLRTALSFFLVVGLIGMGPSRGPKLSAEPSPSQNQAAPRLRTSDDRLIVPGARVGALSLGDVEGRIYQLFPRPAVTETPHGECGTEYSIGVLTDAKHPGSLLAYAREGKLVQIEASGGRYHTAHGILSDSSPEEVRSHYKNLQSYLYLWGTSEALNESPLILWVDETKGIAFSFVRGPQNDPTFSVLSVIVFKPESSFCEQDAVFPDPENWRKLAPYSLEPPKMKT